MSRTQILWFLVSIPTLAACITFAVMLGWGAAGIIFAAAIFPDISLIGAFAREGRLRPERVKFYNFLHSLLIPIPLAFIGCTHAVLTKDFTPLLIGIAWFTHIAIDRACGYRLRAPDGSIRPINAGRAVAA